MERVAGLWSQRRFRRLWASTAISSLGDGVLVVALPLVARTVTTSSRSIAVIFAIAQVPVLLLSFSGAALADRADARRVMVVSDLVRSAVLLALATAAFFDRVSLAAVYVTAFALGCFEVPFNSAAQRMIPTTVPDDLLPRASSSLATAQTSNEQFIGPALGGQMLAWSAVGTGGVTTPYRNGVIPVLGDAASFLASAFMLRGLPSMPAEPRDRETNLRHDIAEGWQWFRTNRILTVVTALVSALAFAQGMVNSLLVQLGAETLRLDSKAIGWFVASIAVGNVIGTRLAAPCLERYGYGACLTLAAALSGVAYAGVGFSRQTWMIVAWLILEGIVVMIGLVSFNVLRQRLIPPALIGRVFTTTRVFIRGSIALGALIGGQIAEHHGPQAAILVGGVLTFFATFALAPRTALRLSTVRS